MKEITFIGNHIDIGRQHGYYLKDEIQEFSRNDFAGINKLCNQLLSHSNLSDYVKPYLHIIRQQLPELYLEICGISEGAGISIDEAILLQIRREIIGINPFILSGDCSSIGILNDEHRILAQTIDLNGNMTNLGHVFNIQINGKPKIIQYCFSGLLGYMGMNDAGVGVAINLVVSGNWQIGIPPYLIVRKFLECDSIDKCLKLLEDIKIASSRSFLIMDKKRLINLEITPTGYRFIEDNFLSHTNHFIHDDFINVDALNIFSKNSSIRRKRLLDEHLYKSPDHTTIQKMFQDHSFYPTGICAHNEGNIKLGETVAAVIMYPHKKEFWALKGKPCQSSYTKFNL
jgi:predicted choloylglycine hydrolase